MARRRSAAGFTLIELVVVITIIGIIAAYGIPQYLRGVESTKADDAIATLRTLAAANRMASMDLNQTTLRAGQLTSSCNGSACPSGGPANGCDLVKCKYVASQDWDNRPYRFDAADGTSQTSCGGKTFASRNMVACATRKSTPGDYNTWGFAIDTNGGIQAIGTNPHNVTGL